MTSFIAGCGSLPSLEGRTATSALTDRRRHGWAARSTRCRRQSGQGGDPRASRSPTTPSPRVSCSPLPRKSRSMCSTTFGIGTRSATCFSRRSGRQPSGACACACCSMTSTRAGWTRLWRSLDAHPNIEVRLYNPVVQRDSRALNFLTDFTRVNRRMHNKSFTADNQVSFWAEATSATSTSVAGGGVGFVDLDVMAVGPAVQRSVEGVRSLLEQPFRLPGRVVSWASRHQTASPNGDHVPDNACRFRIGRVPGHHTQHTFRPGVAARETAIRVDDGAGPVRRPREDARHYGPHRRVAVSGIGADDRPAGKDARPRLAILRAGAEGTASLGALATKASKSGY